MVCALLGPTNTGKTHKAIVRMLEHESGIIGLPLRLLAREVYDRVATQIGQDQVALVTGEEKRVPHRPRYWVCTVEAMPSSREVDFVAVDEIQLVAHRERGHIFTDRLLHSRGRKETWFLGADTVAPLLSRLVPAARVLGQPRFSKLSYAGQTKLSQLKPRSAVIAFSMEEVYALAERIRARRGGAAVVLGALSPRTRNAQVAMFEAGEVDWIVATDAIGMGLNLDVHHVAFASLRKFDGYEVRDLDEAEIAQVAGRAGRWIRDGTFGTLLPAAMHPNTARAVELHKLPAVKSAEWRAHDLDFASFDSLLRSLKAPPRQKGLVMAQDADDVRALERLTARDDVRALAGGENVALLWDICRVPDYKKLLFESHVELLAELFLTLAAPPGVLSNDFMAAQIDELARGDTDVHTLTARIAGLRIWSYVANQAQWVENAGEWRDRTRALEDSMSDALHAALVQRFVSQRPKATHGMRSATRTRTPALARTDESQSLLEGDLSHPFAALRLLRVTHAPAPIQDANDEILDAPHEAFALASTGKISYAGQTVAELVRGRSILLPDVRVLAFEEKGAGYRSRLQKRMLAYARDVVSRLLAPVRAFDNDPSPAVRGLAFLLEEGLGTVLIAAAREQTAQLDHSAKERMDRAGIVIGELSVFAKPLLRLREMATRSALAGLAVPPGALSIRVERPIREISLYVGYIVLGPRAVRCDMAERLLDEDDEATLAQRMGIPRRQIPSVLRAARLIANHASRSQSRS